MALILVFQVTWSGQLIAGEVSHLAGKVTDPMVCQADSNQSYSLYVPSYYSEDDIWPVIFLFDPAGNGMRPLQLFQPAAEEFGYILAASNTAENGPWDNFLEGANAVFKDVEQKFKIDPYRRYTAGFSGAAAAASGLAVMYDGIVGVIGCGAGFSQNYAPHFDLGFHYIGLIGDRDFHYQEMQRLDQVLTRHNVEHFIIEFPGGHDWPPPGAIYEAFQFLEFKAMKYNIIRISDGMIMNFYQENMDLADSLYQAGNVAGAYYEASKVVVFLDDLKRLDEAISKRDSYRSSPEFQEFQAYREELSLREKIYADLYTRELNAYKLSYIDGMTPMQPVKWWKKQVKAAMSMKSSDKKPLEDLLGSRLVDFIWRNAYIYYKTVKGTDLDPISIYYLDIWKAAQDNAISPYYFAAVYYAKYNKKDKAIENIHQAVHNGLEDPAILENDPALQILLGEPEFMAILQRLKADLPVNDPN